MIFYMALIFAILVAGWVLFLGCYGVFSVIQEYWRKNHNKVIDEGDGMYGIASESFKDLCKIHVAEIIEKKENKLVVKYEEKERIVSGFLVPEVKVGESVRIHFAYAVEKI